MKENVLNRPTGALPHSVVSNITDEGKLERQERAIGQDKLLLLHRSPLPTLEQAIYELLSAETRLGTLKSQHLDTVLATHQSRGCPSVQRSDSCRYCHSPDHALLHCPIRVCKHSHKTGPGHYQDDCPRRNSGNTWSKGGHYKSGNRSKSSTASRTAAAEGGAYTVPSSPDPSVLSISMSDIEGQTGSL
jgi:hypothetical protein